MLINPQTPKLFEGHLLLSREQRSFEICTIKLSKQSSESLELLLFDVNFNTSKSVFLVLNVGQ